MHRVAHTPRIADDCSLGTQSVTSLGSRNPLEAQLIAVVGMILQRVLSHNGNALRFMCCSVAPLCNFLLPNQPSQDVSENFSKGVQEMSRRVCRKGVQQGVQEGVQEMRKCPGVHVCRCAGVQVCRCAQMSRVGLNECGWAPCFLGVCTHLSPLTFHTIKNDGPSIF